MTSASLIPKRPEIDIQEAIAFANCSAKDLFYHAGTGQLTIYALAYEWEAGSIRSVDHSKSSSVELIRHDNQATTVGNLTSYHPDSEFGFLYGSPHSGKLPITPDTFKEYLINPESALVRVNLNLLLNLPDSNFEFVLWPKSEVLVRDLIANNKLVVSVDGLTGLRGELPHKTLNEMSDNELWPDEFYVAIRAWEVATNEFKKNPDLGKSPKQFMQDWILEHRQNGSNKRPITKTMAENIAIVANWQKEGGNPGQSDDET